MPGQRFDDDGIDPVDASQDALLIAAAAVAAPIAVANAALDEAGDAVDAAEKFAGDAIDLFDSEDHVVGESTFDVDPDDDGYEDGYLRPGSPEAVAEQQRHAEAATAIDEAKGAGVSEHGLERKGDFGDHRQEPAVVNSGEVTVGPDPIDPDMVGAGAVAGSVTVAPDDAMVSVEEVSPEVALGADVPIDLERLPNADHEPAKVNVGDDVTLVGGDEASGVDSSIIIVGGREPSVVERDGASE